MLEAAGCVAVMPLASLIGSGMGILNPWNLQLVIEKVKVPVLVDAGVGTASDAAIAMELGCDGVLMNTAIAAAQDPIMMARAMKQGDRGRARGVPRRPHAEEALHRGAELAHRRKDRVRRRLEPTRSAATSCARAGPRRRRSARSKSCFRSTASPFSEPEDFFARSARWCWKSAPAWAKPRAEIAKAHPEADFVAVEVHGPGVGSLLNAIEREQLDQPARHPPRRARRARAHDRRRHARGDPPLLPGSLAEEAPPQAPHGAAGVRRAGGAQAARRRHPARGDRLAGLRRAHAARCSRRSRCSSRRRRASLARPVTKFESRGQRLGHPIRELLFRRAGKAPAAR